MSFGAIADDYDRFRPGPPLEAARWVLGHRPGRVLDLGAGTGGLTRQLCALTPTVFAAEPDARMRAVLVDRTEGVHALGARGEALPFADGSLDAVVVSSAWHWMDPAVAVPEVARVLRPGGVFGLLWNGPDRRVEWVSELLQRRRDFERPARDAEPGTRRAVPGARGHRGALVAPGQPRGPGRPGRHLQLGHHVWSGAPPDGGGPH
jgi:SAM-dependent methyltransferase